MDLVLSSIAQQLVSRKSCLAVFGCGIGAFTVAKFLVNIVKETVPSPVVIILESGASDGPSEESRAFSGIQLTSDTSASARFSLYIKGGVFSITPRIFLTDLLTGNILPDTITGIVLLRAERIGHMELFCLRCFREKNRLGFLIGFSEKPDRLARSVEDVMKEMFTDTLLLFPRFHQSIKSACEALTVEQKSVPMSFKMSKIFDFGLRILSLSIKEIQKDSFLAGDVSSLRPVDVLVKGQDLFKWLNNRGIPFKSRQSVKELFNIKSMLLALVKLDAFGFFLYWKELQAASSTAAWLFSEEAQGISKLAKDRVIGVGSEEIGIDLNPKISWICNEIKKILSQNNTEREEDSGREEHPVKRQRTAEEVRILVIVEDSRQKADLERAINFGPAYAALDSASASSADDILVNLKRQLSYCRTDCAVTPVGRITANVLVTASSHDAFSLRQDLEAFYPNEIFIFDPTLTALRTIEMFMNESRVKQDRLLSAEGARLPFSRVVLLTISDSTEDQKLIATRIAEDEAFDQLVTFKRNSMISLPSLMHELDRPFAPSDPPGSSRRAGRIDPAIKLPNTVIVDIRELRSSLPFFLHKKKLKVEPTTLIVGDYVLSRDVCVERKSVPDLIQSLNSGRITNQVEKMSSNYLCPTVLIELDPDFQSFLSLETRSTNDINPNATLTQLVCLALVFPGLSFLCSPSPQLTADLFVELKKNSQQPDLSVAQAKEEVTTPGIEFLKNAPGIRISNIPEIRKKAKSLKELLNLSEGSLDAVLGKKGGKDFFKFSTKKSEG